MFTEYTKDSHKKSKDIFTQETENSMTNKSNLTTHIFSLKHEKTKDNKPPHKRLNNLIISYSPNNSTENFDPRANNLGKCLQPGHLTSYNNESFKKYKSDTLYNNNITNSNTNYTNQINTTEKDFNNTNNFEYFPETEQNLRSLRNSLQKSKQKGHTLTCIAKKSIDPLQIPEEDQIFLQLHDLNRRLKNKSCPKRKGKSKSKSQNKNKKSNRTRNLKIQNHKKQNSNLRTFDGALYKVYKKIPQTMHKIEKVKRMKETLPLFEYQNLLLKTGGKVLPKESRQQLFQKFRFIRKSIEKEYGLFKEVLPEIEKKEQKIITQINLRQRKYNKTMSPGKKEDKKASFFNFNTNFLPEIKFIKTPKYKLNLFKKKIKLIKSNNNHS